MSPFYLKFHDEVGEVIINPNSIDSISNAGELFKPFKTRIVVNGYDVYVTEEYAKVTEAFQEGLNAVWNRSL
jgi:hypothetical protein